MKEKIFTIAFTLLMGTSMSSMAQTAQQVLDKTAAVIGNKNGASANFKMSSPKYGSASGSIAIKGNKFNARTAQAIVWYNGKTQWTYMKKSNEVNVSTPTQAQQMRMNPYTFIHIYQSGYTLGMTQKNGTYNVHLTAQNKQRTIQEMYITVGKNYQPQQVKMRQGKVWTTINITNFKAAKQNDATFSFNSKDFPTAEVIDLR